ncbi:MAG: serine hydrolase [Bryobacterales bacterium]|nr:serine hydrolase [Bryobacterales bacterium]
MKRFIVLLFLSAALLAAQTGEVYSRIADLIQAERQQKNIPAIAIALLDHQGRVWTHTQGEAAENSVYRVGSVSKLFTGIAIMQMVQVGKLDLDAPVTRYLPDFQPRNPFGGDITLRMLMSHRAGLVREPVAGHYFDNSSVTLKQTVASLNQTELVYKPGTRTKYSNAGIAVVGRIIEAVSERPFAEYMKSVLLDPLGMRSSGFLLTPSLQKLLAPAWMWTYDGRRFRAPQFELGMAPAGSLYASMEDMTKFVKCLFDKGAPILDPKTLQQMWQPQYGANYGLGFRLGNVGAARSVSHGGAIYGFATDLTVLPEEKLAAIVVVNMDSANAVATRIAHQALRWLLQAARNEPLETLPSIADLTVDEARRLSARYGEGEEAADLYSRANRLYRVPVRGGSRIQLRRLGGDLIADDLLGFGDRPKLNTRQPVPKPAPVNNDFRRYLGEYGWDHNILYILEHEGKLTALIEWYDYYPLTAETPNTFRFPDWGLYDGERLQFTPEGVRAGGVLFPRRQAAAQGPVFRIQPRRPVPDLTREALAARPPEEKRDFRPSSLIDLTTLDNTVKLDIRYAGTDNFLSTPVYTQAKAFLQRPAAEALVRAHRELNKLGYGLLIHDAYRPWYVTKIFWDATPDDKRIFVADPAKGSRHNRGCAVDLTLYDLASGQPVEMPGLYDEMSERSYPDYPGSTSLARWHREVLRAAMEGQGFQVFDVEWWHFDYKDWELYPIGAATFESIASKE